MFIKFCLTILLGAFCATAPAQDRPPIHLTDNRSPGHEVALTVVFTSLLCLPPLCLPPVHIGGRVVPQPHIVNLFWDNDWNSNNPSSPSRATINGFVQLMTASDYLDKANQYGVSRGYFHSEHESSTVCQTMRPSGATDFSSFQGWITCEVQSSIATGVPVPDDNTIYAVFLPEGVTITGAIGATCFPTAAFHGWSALTVPDPALIALGILSGFKIVGYPYIVIPAECAVRAGGGSPAATLDFVTQLFSHELLEAATDPFPPTGWIDNANSSDLRKWMNTGEAADVCQPDASAPDGIPTAPVRLPNGLLVETYWSNLANGCVTVVDTTPPVITPTITGTLGRNGWYVSDLTVNWSVVDLGSPISAQVGCGPTTIVTDTASTIMKCVAVSEGGATIGSLEFKRDATPPGIGHVVSPSPDGSNGWYASAPTVTFSCSDAGSGLASCLVDGRGSASITLGESPFAQTVAGTATDNAGNVRHDSASGLLVDLTNPTIRAQTDRPANANGWWNAAVTVSFNCADAISGVATCPASSILGQGAGQSVSGITIDRAGRSASVSISGINIDTTAPVVTYTGNRGTYTVDQTINITCAAYDALSGISASTCANITGPAWSFGLGATSRSASATDVAGNTGIGSVSFTVIVTPASLANLITQFLGSNDASGLIAKVNAIVSAPNANAKNGALGAFNNQVDAKTGNPLTPAQAALLKQLAAAL